MKQKSISKNAKKHHIETFGLDICPFCKADITDNAEFQESQHVESGDIEQLVKCLTCGKAWKDTFRLIDVSEICE